MYYILWWRWWRDGTYTYYIIMCITHSVRRQYSVMVVLPTGMAVRTVASFDRSPSRVVRYRFAAAVCVALCALLALTTAAAAADLGSSSSGCAPKVNMTKRKKKYQKNTLREKHHFRPRGSREIADFRRRQRVSLPEPPSKNPPLAGLYVYTTGVLRRNSIYDRVYYRRKGTLFPASSTCITLYSRTFAFTPSSIILGDRNRTETQIFDDPVHYFARYTRVSMIWCVRECAVFNAVCVIAEKDVSLLWTNWILYTLHYKYINILNINVCIRRARCVCTTWYSYIYIMCRPSNKKQLVQTYVHALASNNKK